MSFVPTCAATNPARLSTAKLHERISRLKPIPVGAPPNVRGFSAQRQTVLLLRLAVTLSERLEPQARDRPFGSLRRHLRKEFFLSIRGKISILHGHGSLSDEGERPVLSNGNLPVRPASRGSGSWTCDVASASRTGPIRILPDPSVLARSASNGSRFRQQRRGRRTAAGSLTGLAPLYRDAGDGLCRRAWLSDFPDPRAFGARRRPGS